MFWYDPPFLASVCRTFLFHHLNMITLYDLTWSHFSFTDCHTFCLDMVTLFVFCVSHFVCFSMYTWHIFCFDMTHLFFNTTHFLFYFLDMITFFLFRHDHTFGFCMSQFFVLTFQHNTLQVFQHNQTVLLHATSMIISYLSPLVLAPSLRVTQWRWWCPTSHWRKTVQPCRTRTSTSCSWSTASWGFRQRTQRPPSLSPSPAPTSPSPSTSARVSTAPLTGCCCHYWCLMASSWISWLIS